MWRPADSPELLLAFADCERALWWCPPANACVGPNAVINNAAACYNCYYTEGCVVHRKVYGNIAYLDLGDWF